MLVFLSSHFILLLTFFVFIRKLLFYICLLLIQCDFTYIIPLVPYNKHMRHLLELLQPENGLYTSRLAHPNFFFLIQKNLSERINLSISLPCLKHFSVESHAYRILLFSTFPVIFYSLSSHHMTQQNLTKHSPQNLSQCVTPLSFSSCPSRGVACLPLLLPFQFLLSSTILGQLFQTVSLCPYR